MRLGKMGNGHRRHRILATAALVGAASVTSAAFGQDAMVQYFNQTISMNGTPGIGGMTWDPYQNVYWTASFATADSVIRKIVPTTVSGALSLSYNAGTGRWVAGTTYSIPPDGYNSGIPGSGFGVSSETDWLKFSRSTVVYNGTTLTQGGLAGNGTTNLSTWNGQQTIGNLRLNPVALTIDGMTYAAGTIAIVTDAANITTAAGVSSSKSVYAYDLRNIGGGPPDPNDFPNDPGGYQEAYDLWEFKRSQPGWVENPNTGRDRNGDGFIQWNDVFTTIATRSNFQSVASSTGATNFGRNFAFSAEGATAGKSIYMVDSQVNSGGLWRVDLEKTGTQALTYLLPLTGGSRLQAEPAVVGTSAWDFDLDDSRIGDQIIVNTSDANGKGVAGGIGYFVHNITSGELSAGRTILQDARLNAVYGKTTAGGTGGVTTDADRNIYLYDAGVDTMVRYDTEGRISIIMSAETRSAYQAAYAEETGGGASVLDLQTRTVNITKGAANFDITEVLYSDAAFDAPIGALAFKGGDFNRDNVVDAQDTAFFIQQYNRGTTISSGSALMRSHAGYFDYLKADLNGSAATVSGTAGLVSNATDTKDLMLLFQYIHKVAGDANLDGVVDAADQAILDSGLTIGSGNWLKGDFNRDGLINGDDQALLTANLGQSYTLGGYRPGAAYSGGASGTWSQVLNGNGDQEDDDIITLHRVDGANIAGPAASTRMTYLTIGGNGTGPATRLTLSAGTTLTAVEGMWVKNSGVLAGDSSNTLTLGMQGYAGTLVVENGTLEGALKIKGNLRYVNNDNRTFSGVVENFSGSQPSTLTKTGTGTLTLTGNHSYTGATTINDGAIDAPLTASFLTNSVLQLRGGVLQSNGTFGRSLGTIAGTFNLTAGGGGWAARGGTLTVDIAGGTNWTYGATNFVPTAGPLVFGSNTADSMVDFVDGLVLATGTGMREVRVIDNPASTTDFARISGVISGTSATAALLKTGNGNLVLTGTNTYLGATSVTAGRLTVDGTLAAGGGTVVVTGSGTLGGSGTIDRAVSVSSGGTIAPGSSAGRLRTGNLTLAAGGVAQFEIGGTTPATQYDQIDVTGTVNVTGGTLDLSILNGFQLSLTEPQQFFLVLNDGADAVIGEFAGLAQGAQISGFWISYTGNSSTGQTIGGNDIVAYTPEPASLSLVALGAGALLRRRRRRGAPE